MIETLLVEVLIWGSWDKRMKTLTHPKKWSQTSTDRCQVSGSRSFSHQTSPRDRWKIPRNFYPPLALCFGIEGHYWFHILDESGEVLWNQYTYHVYKKLCARRQTRWYQSREQRLPMTGLEGLLFTSMMGSKFTSTLTARSSRNFTAATWRWRITALKLKLFPPRGSLKNTLDPPAKNSAFEWFWVLSNFWL